MLPLKRSWRGVEGRIGFTRGELETRAMRTQPGCFGKFTQTLKSWLSQEMLIWVWSCVLVFIALHRCCLVCMDQEENEALQYLHCMIEKLLEKLLHANPVFIFFLFLALSLFFSAPSFPHDFVLVHFYFLVLQNRHQSGNVKIGRNLFYSHHRGVKHAWKREH